MQLKWIKGNKYILEENDMEAQNVILKTDRTKKDADVLEGKNGLLPLFCKNSKTMSLFWNY